MNNAIDTVPIDGEPADRAVLADDGRAIRLALYAGAETLGSVVLDPAAAVRLAGRLIEAASRRMDAAPGRRGGDPRSEKRAQRDGALRGLAALLGDGASAERQADLAKAAGIAQQTIVDFERGARTPYPKTLVALQRALEAAGIEFLLENGVRLKTTNPARPV